jgi:Predicted polymerase, most proteins contain PALM domain, HD hydrolase domain and Zn-ribbon domain
VGDNTFLDEDDTVLKAACDGVVHYVRDVISVRDLLQITGNVDQHTGNIQFPGDVSVSGDVYSGYSLRSGGA